MERSTEELLEALQPLFGGRLTRLVLTENRSTFLTAKPDPEADDGCYSVRLHRVFSAAPVDVLEAVAAFILGRRRNRRRTALEVLRSYFAEEAPEPPAPARRAPLRPRGEVHDLVEIRDRLADRHFDGRARPRITWGRWQRAKKGRPRRGLQLGSYSWDDGIIRIHPVLDRPEVPLRVVEAVVYHEMLHAAIRPLQHGGRRRVHTPEFRRLERQLEGFDEAERWIDDNLARLLRLADRGAGARRPQGR